MQKFIFVLALGFIGCANVTGMTKQGWMWEAPPHTATGKDIETVTNVTIKEFEKATGLKVPPSSWHKIQQLTFTYFSFNCSSDSGKCLGYTDFVEKTMTVKIQGHCLSASSLAHELIHVFARATNYNMGHDNPRADKLFIEDAKGDQKYQTVEHRAKSKAFRALGCRDIVLF